MMKEELIQVHKILAISCLDLTASDYESVKINNLCQKMTLHRIYIVYHFGRWLGIYGLLQSFYDYITTDAEKSLSRSERTLAD